jgi:hypothetical protein
VNLSRDEAPAGAGVSGPKADGKCERRAVPTRHQYCRRGGVEPLRSEECLGVADLVVDGKAKRPPRVSRLCNSVVPLRQMPRTNSGGWIVAASTFRMRFCRAARHDYLGPTRASFRYRGFDGSEQNTSVMASRRLETGNPDSKAAKHGPQQGGPETGDRRAAAWKGDCGIYVFVK